MEPLAPFRMTLPLSIPAADRESLLMALKTQAAVQPTEHKDGTLEAVFAIVKQAGEVAEAIVNIATLATMLYGWSQALRARGLLPNITLFRPDQPELNLSQVQSAQEIEAWLRRTTR